MARKTLLDTEQPQAGKSTPARGEQKHWLVTYSQDGGEKQTIPVEALEAHAAQAVVEANMPKAKIHGVVLDDEARRAVLAMGSDRPARPDPKPGITPNRGRTKAAKVPASKTVAEKAKPSLKGKTPAEVAKADKADKVAGILDDAATTTATKKATSAARVKASVEHASSVEPKQNPNADQAKRAEAKAKLQAEVVKLWNASKEQDAGARRKAIAKKLGIPGRVMGILRDAGIDGKVT